MEEKTVYYRIRERDNKVDQTTQARNILDEMLKSFNLLTSEYYYNEYGKPYFNNNIKFNYSHSKKYIVVAIALDDVGIDIEDKNRVISDEVASRYLDDVVGNDKRLECWVLKEAYTKLLGVGFSYGFNNIKLDKIENSKLVIDNNNYICAIYSNNDMIFKEI